MERTKILIVGDSLASFTGLSYVALNYMKALYQTGKYELGYCITAGDPFTIEDNKFQTSEDIEILKNIKIFHASLFDKVKVDAFDNVVFEFKPNIVITFGDPWVVDQIAYCFYRESFKWIAYLTIEVPIYPDVVCFPTPISKNFNKSIKDILEKADLLISCSKMGIKTLSNWKLNNIYEDNLYCGLDIKNFLPYKKSDIFGHDIKDDDFIFITVGANSERKRIDQVVEVFYYFLLQKKEEERNKYKLYLHTNLNQITGGTDLRGMLKYLGLMKNVLIPSNYGASKDILYKKYMASDCYIGLAGGEGFGYGFAEALMCDLPIIYMDYGGHVEYCEDFGVPVKPKAFFTAVNAYIKFAIPDVQEGVKQMNDVIDNYPYHKKNARKGRKFIVENMSWKVLGVKFQNIIDNFISDTIDDTPKTVYDLYTKRII